MLTHPLLKNPSKPKIFQLAQFRANQKPKDKAHPEQTHPKGRTLSVPPTISTRGLQEKTQRPRKLHTSNPLSLSPNFLVPTPSRAVPTGPKARADPLERCHRASGAEPNCWPGDGCQPTCMHRASHHNLPVWIKTWSQPDRHPKP